MSDTGIAMSQDQMENIFKPFWQVDNSGSRCFSGTGLGLAIVHSFCTMLGGEIHISSQLGEGSRFAVRLPCGQRLPRVQE